MAPSAISDNFTVTVSPREQTGSGQMPLHHGRQLRTFQKAGACPGDKDDVVARFYTVAVPGKRRSDDASGSVALHRAADFLSGRYPQTTDPNTVLDYNRHQCGVLKRFTAGISAAEIAVAFYGLY